VLTLPPFTLHRPATVAEAVALRADTGGRYIAGGTDLLPNLKQGLDAPKHLIAVDHLAELHDIAPERGGVRVGAGVTLKELAGSDLVRGHLPALAEAAGLVAGPQHRHMGTLGGNVMLDTRCVFLNQTRAWRDALGGCLKAEGDWCHVLGSAKACVAAQSSDTVPVLVAANAVVRAETPTGPVEQPIRALYGTDGRLDRLHHLPAGALVTGVFLPELAPGTRSTYRKVRSRAAVDFPQLSVAALLAIDDDDRLIALEVVLGALLPQPRRVRHLDPFLGKPLSDPAVEAIAEHARKQARPQPQVHSDPNWRRSVVPVEVARALRSLRRPG